MKRSVVILAATLLGLSVLGWGCVDSRPTREVKNPIPQKQANAIKQSQTATSVADVPVTPSEPVALGYLQLTQGAAATVWRGDEKTDAANDMELYAGDTVEVTTGEINILYPDTGVSLVQAPAKFTIIPDPDAGEKGLGTRILMEAGKIWTRLERLLGSDEEFSVESSNVVATVRGTAFGFALVDGDVDVSVVESKVKVIGQTMLNVGTMTSSSVLIAAGDAIRVKPDELTKTANIKTVLQRQMRRSSATEKQDIGYVFAQRKFTPGRLTKPEKPFRWAVPPVLQDIKSRLVDTQLKRWEAAVAWMAANRNELERAQAQLRLEQVPIRFMPPLRQVLELEMIPTTTPKVLNPPRISG